MSTEKEGPSASASVPTQPCLRPPPQTPPAVFAHDTTDLGNSATLTTTDPFPLNDGVETYWSQEDTSELLPQLSLIEHSSWSATGDFWLTETHAESGIGHLASISDSFFVPPQDSSTFNLDGLSNGRDLSGGQHSEHAFLDAANFEYQSVEGSPYAIASCSDSGQLPDSLCVQKLIADSVRCPEGMTEILTARDLECDYVMDNPNQGVESDGYEVRQSRKFPNEPSWSKDSAQNHVEAGSTYLGQRMHRRKLQRPSTIIRNWYSTHSSSPYPTPEEIAALVTLSGLSKEQVKQCLSNLRARIKPSPIKQAHPATFVKAQNYGSIKDPSYDLFRPCTQLPVTSVTAVASTYMNDVSGDSYQLESNPSDRFSSPYSDDAQSKPQQHPQVSLNMVYKRKGKRQHPSRFGEKARDAATSSANQNSEEDDLKVAKIYGCTLCCKSFKNIYGWKRHEAGVHRHIDVEWVCMLNESLTTGSHCVFCSETVTGVDHLDMHGIQTCLDKDICERTFNRKDLLKQHIEQKHCVSKAFQVPKAWLQKVDSSQINQQGLWCGFCLTTRSSITERMDHVAQHFRNGCNMVSWKAPAGYDSV